MSGPGDIDGEVSGDEAAWRDLIARFDVPADLTDTAAPWPAREDLPESAIATAGGRLDSADPTGPAVGSGGSGGSTGGPGARTADLDGSSADPGAGTAGPDAGIADPGAGITDPDVKPAPDQPGGRTTSYYIPIDRTRVIRPAGDPRSYSPPDEQDEAYVPAPLPPPAKLDSISKAAIAGVIGGPGYLLVVSVFLHWTVSAEAAFIAVAAFIAGFVTLIVKLGDRSRQDDDDDGAVL